MLECLYLYLLALHNLTPSMIEAWFNSSLIIASSAPNKGSNTPPLASKQAAYKIVSSVPKKSDTFYSTYLCKFWVPQINLTEDNP